MGGRHPARFLPCLGRRSAVCHADLEGLRAAGRLHGEVDQPRLQPAAYGGVRRWGQPDRQRAGLRALAGEGVGDSLDSPTVCDDEAACEARALAACLTLGKEGTSYPAFGAPTYETKGCYYYEEGTYAGAAYFGRGGTAEQEAAAPPAGSPKIRLLCDTTTPSFCEEPTSAAVVTRRPFDVRRGFELAYRVDSKSQGCSHPSLTLPSKVEDVTTSDKQEQLAIAGEVFPVDPSAGAAEWELRYLSDEFASPARTRSGSSARLVTKGGCTCRRTTRRSNARGCSSPPVRRRGLAPVLWMEIRILPVRNRSSPMAESSSNPRGWMAHRVVSCGVRRRRRCRRLRWATAA